MATKPNPNAAGNTALGDTKEVVVEGREARNLPAPEHGDPTETQPPAQGETVLGVRVGSEAAVEDGTDPVLPGMGGLAGATEVKNKTLRERDEQERKRRGLSGAAARTISITFEGLMMIERKSEGEGDLNAKQMVSGSFTGVVPEDGLHVRPLTPEEEADIGTPAGQRQSRRANDLVKGSGTGGGGNPMHAGDTRGTSSRTAAAAGEGGVTSKAGGSPPSQGTGPQGGGTTTRG